MVFFAQGCNPASRTVLVITTLPISSQHFHESTRTFKRLGSELRLTRTGEGRNDCGSLRLRPACRRRCRWSGEAHHFRRCSWRCRWRRRDLRRCRWRRRGLRRLRCGLLREERLAQAFNSLGDLDELIVLGFHSLGTVKVRALVWLTGALSRIHHAHGGADMVMLRRMLREQMTAFHQGSASLGEEGLQSGCIRMTVSATVAQAIAAWHPHDNPHAVILGLRFNCRMRWVLMEELANELSAEPAALALRHLLVAAMHGPLRRACRG